MDGRSGAPELRILWHMRICPLFLLCVEREVWGQREREGGREGGREGRCAGLAVGSAQCTIRHYMEYTPSQKRLCPFHFEPILCLLREDNCEGLQRNL